MPPPARAAPVAPPAGNPRHPKEDGKRGLHNYCGKTCARLEMAAAAPAAVRQPAVESLGNRRVSAMGMLSALEANYRHAWHLAGRL